MYGDFEFFFGFFILFLLSVILILNFIFKILSLKIFAAVDNYIEIM